MKTIQEVVQNTGQRKRNCSSTLTKPGNIYAHALDVNISPVPHINRAFTGVPPPFGTAQAILLRLAQLEAQLVLNMISNITAGNHSSYGNPFVLLCLLQAAATQRTPFLPMYQPPNLVVLSHLLHRRNVNNTTHMLNPPSMNGTVMSSVTEISSVVTSQGNYQAKEVIQKTTTGLGLSSKTMPMSGKTLDRFNANHPDQNFSKSMTAIKGPTDVKTSPDVLDSTTLGEKEPQQQAMLHLPSESLTKALTTFGLSLEDLELLSHCPDDLLTKEMLPYTIKDMQKRKGVKDLIHPLPECNKRRVIEYGHASMISSDRAHMSSYTNGKHHSQGNPKFIVHSKLQEDHRLSQSVSSFTTPLQSPYRLRDSQSHESIRSERYNTSDLIHKNFSTHSKELRRDSSGKGSKLSAKRLPHGLSDGGRRRSSSVYISSRSTRHSFISPGNKTHKNYIIQRPSSHNRSVTSNVVRKDHNEITFSSVMPERTTESVNMENAKPSTQTRGVIRLSRIPLDFSESELIKMAAPFGQSVEVFTATEIDMITRLEWKKALVMLPTEVSAQEMVKIYSAIPPHMREQSLELVPQTVDPTSPVSVFHAFVGPSSSNGLLTPVDHLLVVCNVPHRPCAATGVLRLLKPFGKVFRTLVFYGNKVDVEQCTGNSCIQMVLEMESAAVALSVYEWSQKIPCIYHNHRLSFLIGSNMVKNKSEVKSA